VAATEGEKPMLTRKQARELLRLCKSTRKAKFKVEGKRGVVKAVSVASRDSGRSEVVRILEGQEPLLEDRTWLATMPGWMSQRDWYQVK
jgi:hypothetical protein